MDAAGCAGATRATPSGSAGRRPSCGAGGSPPLAAVAILAALLGSATNLHLGNADPDTIAKSGAGQAGPRRARPLGHRQGRDRAGRDARARGRRGEGRDGAGRGRRRPRRRRPPAARSGAATGPRSSSRSRAPATSRRPGATRCRTSATPPTRPRPTPAWAGAARSNADFIDAVYGSFPLMIGVISLLTFVLLARAFRSLLLPLKAILLNILSHRRGVGRHDARLAGGPRLRRAVGDRRRPARSRRGSRSSCSRSCTGCRWTTRSSSSPASARSTTRRTTPTRRSCAGSRARAGS